MNGMLLFLNISGGEILVILVVVYLVFGPKKIPELARMLGKGINEMRRATSEIRNEINKEISGVKKDMGVDIDLKDPMGIKKTVEDTFKPIDLDEMIPEEENKAAGPKGTVEKKTPAKEKKTVAKKENKASKDQEEAPAQG